MAIAYQPATAQRPISTRPAVARSPHVLVAFELPVAGRTVAKLVGLVALTALGVAAATALVVGTALCALLVFGG